MNRVDVEKAPTGKKEPSFFRKYILSISLITGAVLALVTAGVLLVIFFTNSSSSSSSSNTTFQIPITTNSPSPFISTKTEETTTTNAATFSTTMNNIQITSYTSSVIPETTTQIKITNSMNSLMSTTTSSEDISLMSTTTSSEDISLTPPVAVFGELIQVFYGHTNRACKVVELASGRLASLSQDDTVRIWDRTMNGQILKIKVNQRYYNKFLLAALPDGSLAAALFSFRQEIEIFSSTSGNVMKTLRGHQGFVTGFFNNKKRSFILIRQKIRTCLSD